MSRKLSRRAVLRGAGGLALTLPFLEMFSAPAIAQATTPKRFILFFHHQGTILRHWAQPGSSETNFTLGEIMTPLEPWRDRCLWLYGVDNKVAPLNRSNGHNSSARTCVTAQLYSTSGWSGERNSVRT